jgi:hypothetical protein
MTAIAYKTKSGATQYKPCATSDEFFDHDTGWCLACGTEAYGVEPDARQYPCESCDAHKVYGLEELLMMGLAEVTE